VGSADGQRQAWEWVSAARAAESLAWCEPFLTIMLSAVFPEEWKIAHPLAGCVEDGVFDRRVDADVVEFAQALMASRLTRETRRSPKGSLSSPGSASVTLNGR